MPILGQARTLVVPYPTAAPAFGARPTQLVWPDKSSADVLPFGLDLSEWLRDVDDTLTEIVTIAITPTGDAFDLISSGPFISGNVVEVTFESGIPGTIYKVEISVETSEGLILALAPLIAINFNSPPVKPPTPPSNAILISGTPIAVAGQIITIGP